MPKASLQYFSFLTFSSVILALLTIDLGLSDFGLPVRGLIWDITSLSVATIKYYHSGYKKSRHLLNFFCRTTLKFVDLYKHGIAIVRDLEYNDTR